MKLSRPPIPRLSRRVFLQRWSRPLGLAAGILAFSLGLGSLGYHWFGDLSWVDSLLNASMILTGMGPVDRMPTDAGKLFAAGYAIFSGVVFLTVMAFVLGPLVHRLLHRFHVEEGDEEEK